MSATKKTWALFIILFFITFYNGTFAKKKVCVIGAGRAGLAAIKIVAEQTENFETVAFERNSDVGGLWIYREDPEFDENGQHAHSGIYKNLRTVTDKDYMTYPDYPNIASTDGSIFIPHEVFLEYMRNYTDNFGLRKYIQFNTLVTKVTPLNDTCTHGTTRWRLEKRDLKTQKYDTTICDAVIVCNGRFSKPNIPNIPGIDTFTGRVLHSRSYRKPEDYANQTVVLLGAGLSGIGITRDLAHHAKAIYLSHKYDYIFDDDEFTGNVYLVKEVVRADGNQLILRDNSKIVADTLIYCTGYVYDFPFLDENSGIVLGDQFVHPLHGHFINKKYPSMAFIGLGYSDVSGPHFYSEVKISVNVDPFFVLKNVCPTRSNFF